MRPIIMHRKENKRKIIGSITILYASMLIFIFSSCSPGTDGPGYKTHTPTSTPTATCDPGIQLNTPVGWSSGTRLVIILYDERAIVETRRPLEYADRENTTDITLFIQNLIPTLIGPGDQISIFQLGYDKYAEARVTRMYSFLSAPQLYDTPAPPEMATPLGPPPTPGGSLVDVAAADAHRQATQERPMILTQTAVAYGCKSNMWNLSAKGTATAWGVVESVDEEEISNGVNNDLDIAVTPRGTYPRMNGGLYYGLQWATKDLETECKKYDECILLVFDDLHRMGEIPDVRYATDLSGVKVYSVIPDCYDLNQDDCESVKNIWSTEFMKYGVTLDDIHYYNGLNLENLILEDIRR